jgi:hypothetical protein
MIARSYLTLFSIITTLITILAVANVWDASVEQTNNITNTSYKEGLNLANETVQSYITTVNDFKPTSGADNIYGEI